MIAAPSDSSFNGRHRGGAIRESVLGSSFFTAELTTVLLAHQQRVHDYLAAVVHSTEPTWTVRAFDEVIADDVFCVPELTVRDARERLRVVVEIRTDSTDRYALGLKRLAYEVAGAREYWYLDPGRGSVSVMSRRVADTHLSWPPEVHGPDRPTLVSQQLPTQHHQVADILAPFRRRR